MILNGAYFFLLNQLVVLNLMALLRETHPTRTHSWFYWYGHYIWPDHVCSQQAVAR